MRSFVLVLGIALSSVIGGSQSVRAQDLPRRGIFGASVAEDSQGVRIIGVFPDTPAATAGLHVGDIIIRLGDSKISVPADFIREVHAAHANSRLAVTFLRAGIAGTVNVLLVAAPMETDPDVQIRYSSINVGGSLRRTLITSPAGATAKLPALLLIGGIGCYSVDNAADSHDPYRILAHDLSRAGIVVMRIEKSGVGDSQGAPCFETDFAWESLSYEVGLNALISDPQVDPTKVFLFGHSIGTLIAPRLALGKPVAGIIVAEGVGINWFEYELANLRRQAVLNGDSPTETDSLLRSKEVCMHHLLIDRESEPSLEARMPECKTRNAYPVAPGYMQEVAALNIAEPWAKVNVPVLAIYGTADFVTDKADHQRIVEIVNSRHPGTAEFETIDGMDHHLEIMGTPQNAYDVRVKQHGQGPYAEQLSTLIRTWICARSKCISSH